MPNDLRAMVDDLWQASDRTRRAREIRSILGQAERAHLHQVAESLTHRAASRGMGASPPGVRHLPEVDRDEDSHLEGLLILLTLAMHHSDTLVYLPERLREKRLLEWSEDTGFDVPVVKEASIMGPVGLAGLLDQTAFDLPETPAMR